MTSNLTNSTGSTVQGASGMNREVPIVNPTLASNVEEPTRGKRTGLFRNLFG